MIELFIGAVCGAIAGLWFDVVAWVAFFQMARTPGSWAARVAADKSPIVFLSPLLLFHSLWTLAGLLLGLAYRAIVSDDAGGPGSPFTIGVGAAAGVLALVAIWKVRPHAMWLASFGAVFFLLFGLLLPAWAR
ncbi:MAG: hypothetical protein FJ315_02310 [SAR202 cluster bacterium]|nr:hypothetical protein [SAR202 cluster bacterium]